MSGLERRVRNLEVALANMVKTNANTNKYVNYDLDSGRKNTAKVQNATDKNTEDIMENTQDINIHNDVIGEIAEEILPTMTNQTADITEAIDQLLTEIIPELVEGANAPVQGEVDEMSNPEVTE